MMQQDKIGENLKPSNSFVSGTDHNHVVIHRMKNASQHRYSRLHSVNSPNTDSVGRVEEPRIPILTARHDEVIRVAPAESRNTLWMFEDETSLRFRQHTMHCQ